MMIPRSVFVVLLVMALRTVSSECPAQLEQTRVGTLTTSEVAQRIGQPGWLIVDVRDSNAFNGWIMNGEQRGGHIRGAANFSLNWLKTHLESSIRLIEWKGLNKNRIVLYGDSMSEARQMASILQTRADVPPDRIFIYSDGIGEWSRDNELPMGRLPRFEKLVPPHRVHQLIKEGETEKYRIVEVAWRKKKQYETGHIPGAVYLDTDEIESEPMWNIVSADELEQALLSLGITKDTFVVVYGRDTTAAARAAVVMMYAGVSDVRLLNGGYQAWVNAGCPVATGDVQPAAAAAFGARIPVHPDWIVGIERAREVLAAPHGKLVSIRSWPEYIGQTSGYAYIQRKGRIRGAVWGRVGKDRNHMEDFRNPDNTMRDYHEIAANWRALNIEPDNLISFYCGTGWRASEAFFAAYLMGYENISVYDGGWHEWSADTSNPIADGMPNSEFFELQPD